MLASDFATLSELVRAQAAERGAKTALVFGDQSLSYTQLDRGMDRVAAALQRDGVGRGQAVAIVASTSLDYAVVFLGAVRAGCAAAPLAPSATPEQLAAMVVDCGAPILFHDAAHAGIETGARKVALDAPEFAAWLAPEGTAPRPVILGPDDPFNIIYSSGTTGTPKGIVQPHAMRWAHISRAPANFGDAVTMIATPLY